MDVIEDDDFDLDEMLGVETAEEPAPSDQPPDPRRHRVVCKHWLRGLCKRGDDCDFLHVYDPARMPQCLCVARPAHAFARACATCPHRPPHTRHRLLAVSVPARGLTLPAGARSFFQHYGECTNKDCIFLHTRTEEKARPGRCGHTPP